MSEITKVDLWFNYPKGCQAEVSKHSLVEKQEELCLERTVKCGDAMVRTYMRHTQFEGSSLADHPLAIENHSQDQKAQIEKDLQAFCQTCPNKVS